MKTDLKNTTFIYCVRIDTPQRAKNLEIVYNFYKKYCFNYQNIFIEDSSKQQIPGIINFDEADTYIFKYNKGMYRRCEAFNQGALVANKSDVVCFCDTDVIIDPKQIQESVNEIINSNACIFYPYNGLFLCVSEEIKHSFSQTLDIQTLNNVFPDKLITNYQTRDVLVGHTASQGGFVMANRNNFLKINGYNSNFIGWGYEDNEIAKRAWKLKFDVVRLNGPKQPLWHLPHDGPGQSPKAENPYYENNRQLSNFVDNSSYEELQEYIKTWKLL